MRMRSLLKTGNPERLPGHFGTGLAYARPTKVAKTPGQRGIVRTAEVVRDAPENASQAVDGFGALDGWGSFSPFLLKAGYRPTPIVQRPYKKLYWFEALERKQAELTSAQTELTSAQAGLAQAKQAYEKAQAIARVYRRDGRGYGDGNLPSAGLAVQAAQRRVDAAQQHVSAAQPAVLEYAQSIMVPKSVAQRSFDGLGADAPPPPDWLATLQTAVGAGANLYSQQQAAKSAQSIANSAQATATAAQNAVAAQMKAAQAGAALRPASTPGSIPWIPIAVGAGLLLVGGFFLLRKKG